MRQFGRILRGAAIALAAAAVIAAVAAMFALRSDWFHEKVRLRIISEVERITGGRAEAGGFHFGWKTLEAEVNSFTLHGREAAGEPPLFQARSIRVGLKVVSLFDRDINIQSLAVTEPRIRIVVYPDGSNNLPRPEVARLRRNPFERFLSLAIARFRIESGLLLVNERRVPLDVRGEKLAASMFYERDGPRYSGDVSFRQLTLTPSTGPIPPLDADLTVSLESNRLLVRSATLVTKSSRTQVLATVEELLHPRVSGSFDGHFSLREFLPAIGSPPVASGFVHATGEFKLNSISDYGVSAHIDGAGLSAQVSGARVSNARVASSLAVLPGRVDLKDLNLGLFGGVFRGEASITKPRRFRLTGQIGGVSIEELARAKRIERNAWNGTISGPLDVQGELTQGGAGGLTATASLSVEASAKDRPLTGSVNISFDQRAGTLELRESRLSTAATSVEFDGTLNKFIRVNLRTADLSDLLIAASLAGASLPSSLPVSLNGEPARFSGTVTGTLQEPEVSGRVTASRFIYEDREFDGLEADVRLSRNSLRFGGLTIRQGGARLTGKGQTVLTDWRISGSDAIEGSFSLQSLALSTLLAEAGSKAPLSGTLSGTFQVTGTANDPRVTGNIALAQAVAYGERLDRARAGVRADRRLLRLEAVEINAGRGRILASAAFEAETENWSAGTLRFDADGTGLRLAQAGQLAGLAENVDGEASFKLRADLSVGHQRMLLTNLAGSIALDQVMIAKKVAGDVRLTAETQGSSLSVKMTAEGLGMRGAGRMLCKLEDSYPMDGEASLESFSLSKLKPWLLPAARKELPMEAVTDGKLVFTGNALDSSSWKGRLELPRVEVRPEATGPSDVLTLRSAEPVVLALNRKEAVIESARFTGTGTSLTAAGRIALGGPSPEYNVRMRGQVNLEVLRNFDPNLTTAGDSELDLILRGPLTQPELNGQLDLRQASVSLRGLPNGIEGANGRILLSRDRATIEKLTARTGSGTVQLEGWLGFGGEHPAYGVHATVRQVRVRYPEGVSTTFDANLDLRGSTSNSLLSGSATVSRVSVASNVDVASVVSRPSQPMIASGTQNELLRGMQFDVKVDTSQDARLETALSRDIQAEAALNLRGTPYKPVLLGRVTISQGEINFMGNRYRISRGEITLVNPVKLEPIIDLDLYTRVRGIDITMNFTGPPDRLNVAYRSDPPFQANEIIPLLAVGRTPTSDPTVLAKQTEKDQSWQQIGASTLVGQALETLEAGRLQRFFGVSRIKIDPKLTGLGNIPEAQVTLEQQVSKNVTFTYVTSFAQEQQQLVRVEWTVSRQWSVLAVREENGLFGVEIQFKKQFR
jgi:translocation and assembly module TamB